MTDRLGLEPNDNVLFLGIPDPALAAGVAVRVESGSVVGLGSPDEVAAARRATVDLENVMFAPASPDEIPWIQGYFQKIVAFGAAWQRPEQAAREVARVLAPGGEVWVDPHLTPYLEPLGFYVVEVTGAEFVHLKRNV
jgi:ubiquinone/menaquinone biosynthesis C-methylase UbiE